MEEGRTMAQGQARADGPGAPGELHRAAAEAIRAARVLVITAGAGMGVDSGLPDFRGTQGFWRAYPAFERLGLSFEELADPVHFEEDPALGWGFYGHRAALYRRTVPHAGFALLRRWIDERGLASFVVTSNVDGQFQKAGFPAEEVLEIHGSIHHLQCSGPCSCAIWRNQEEVEVDQETMRAKRLPRCPRCRAVARPNILMFGDGAWLSARSDEQRERYQRFLDAHEGEPAAVVELGAGSAIPSIRAASERLGRRGARVIRVNPREPQIAPPHLGLPQGALEALQAIDRALDG